MIKTEIEEHLQVFHSLVKLEPILQKTSERLINAMRKGNKILVCGNGGSAADSLHFSTELVGRYKHNRQAWPVVDLASNTATITAIANDYGFNQVFARQVEAHGNPGDILLGISTSGDSQNIIDAFTSAKEKRIFTIGLTGFHGEKNQKNTDISINIPSNNTPRIQEAHIFLLHYFAHSIETTLITE